MSVGSLSPGAPKVLFEPSEHIWGLKCLILNGISPLLPSCLDFFVALGCGFFIFFFFNGIQHSTVDGCSVASCNFGVLTGKDDLMYFYFTNL